MGTLSLTLAANRPVRYCAPIRVLRGIAALVAAFATAQMAAKVYNRLNNHTGAQPGENGMRRADVARTVVETCCR